MESCRTMWGSSRSQGVPEPIQACATANIARSTLVALHSGGVSKEFFQLLTRDLFARAFGMFELCEETREYYPSPSALELGASGADFRAVGVILGLAILNGILLDVRAAIFSLHVVIRCAPLVWPHTLH